MSTVNDQVTDAVTQINALLTGGAGSQSMGMLDIAGAETMGMSMFNAVTAQQNAQTSSSAAATASCAKMLQTPIMQAVPPKSEKQKLLEELQKLELNDHKLALKLAVAVIVALADKLASEPVTPPVPKPVVDDTHGADQDAANKTVTPATPGPQNDVQTLLTKTINSVIANNSEFSNASQQSVHEAINLLNNMITGATSGKSS